MAVNPEQLFKKGTDTVYRDSVAEGCSVNENVSTDLPAEPHHMSYTVGVQFSPIITSQMLNHNIIQNIGQIFHIY